MRISPVAALRGFAAFWTEIARNTPLTLDLLLHGVRAADARRAAAVHRSSRSSPSTYYTSPFVAEALRSGINGVPIGQAEAARSIGLGFGQTVSLVVLPQAFRMTVPPLINVFIALTKNTSVAGGFFVVELFATTRQLANDNGNIVLPDPLHGGRAVPGDHRSAGLPRRAAREALGGEAMTGTSVLFDAPGPKARRISLHPVDRRARPDPRRRCLDRDDARRAARAPAESPCPACSTAPAGTSSSTRRCGARSAEGVVATLQAAAVAGGRAPSSSASCCRSCAAPRSRGCASRPAWLIEFLRGMPVLLMMLFILLVASTGAFWAVVIALILYNGTLIGEILRAGLVALPRGQREAALSVGMREFQSKMLVEFPQAFRQMLPIIIAQLVVLLKDTSLGYIVGYNEIIRNNINNLGSFYGNRYLFSLFVVTLRDLPRDQPDAVVVRALARRAAPRAAARGSPPRRDGRPTRRPRRRCSRSRRRRISPAAAALSAAPRPRSHAARERHPPSVDSSLVSDVTRERVLRDHAGGGGCRRPGGARRHRRRIRYRRPQGRPRRAHRRGVAARAAERAAARCRTRAQGGVRQARRPGPRAREPGARRARGAARRGRDRRAARGGAHRRHGARRRARASGRGIRSRSCRSRSPTSSSAWGGRSPRVPSSSTSGTTSTR